MQEKRFKSSSSQLPLLVSREEAARLLSICPRSVDYMIADGRIKTRHMGSRTLIPMSEVVRLSNVDITIIRSRQPQPATKKSRKVVANA